MAQTQTRPRGQSSTAQQQPPREAPRGNVPATQGDSGGNSSRGLSAAQRGQQGLAHLSVVAEQFISRVDRWCASLMEMTRSQDDVLYFRKVLITAAAEKPDLYFADQRTLFTAAMKCFNDGCIPDGRDAALVVYPGTRLKVRGADGVDTEIRIDAVQYMPMVRGIIRRMLESGLVTKAYADAVYSNDHFVHHRGLNEDIEHRAPKMGEARGDLIGAYAIIRLANGEVLIDSMDKPQIMAAKAKSKTGDNGMLWRDFPWEAYKKTVLRRLSKSAPVSPNIRRLADREDEPFEHEIDDNGAPLLRTGGHAPFEYPAYTVREAEPEPQPGTNHTAAPEDPIELTFDVVNLDGEVTPFTSAFRAFDAVVTILGEATKLGVQRIDGFWESNQDLLDAMAAGEHGNLTGELAQRYADARDAAEAGERQTASAAARQRQEEAEREAAAQAADKAARERQAAANAPPAQGSVAVTPPAPEQGDPGPGGDERADQNRVMAEDQAEQNGERPFPGDMPSKGPPPADRPADMPAPINVPTKNNKPDLRTFAVALLGPKVRAAKTTADLALLLGANEASLDKCRAPGALDKDDLSAMEANIKTAYDKLFAAGV